MNPQEPLFDHSQLEAACLLSPGNVQALLKRRPSIRTNDWRGRWLLGCTIPAALYDCLRNSVDVRAMPYRATVIASPAGATYAVLTTQAAEVQHRLILPLYEPLVLQFLDALQHETYLFFLQHADAGESMTLSISDSSRDVMRELRPLARSPELRTGVQAIDEFRDAVQRLSRLSAVSSLNGQRVERVSVSPLVPSSYIGSLVDGGLA